jgi:hypothetical protein
VQITSAVRKGFRAQRADRSMGGLLSEHRHAGGVQFNALAVARRVVTAPGQKNWEEGMNAKQIASVTRKTPPLPADWGRLIQKLRWIGLDEDATRLESAVCRLPPEERCELICTPVETD